VLDNRNTVVFLVSSFGVKRTFSLNPWHSFEINSSPPRREISVRPVSPNPNPPISPCCVRAQCVQAGQGPTPSLTFSPGGFGRVVERAGSRERLREVPAPLFLGHFSPPPCLDVLSLALSALFERMVTEFVEDFFLLHPPVEVGLPVKCLPLTNWRGV